MVVFFILFVGRQIATLPTPVTSWLCLLAKVILVPLLGENKEKKDELLVT